jgi:hypothetical protein
MFCFFQYDIFLGWRTRSEAKRMKEELGFESSVFSVRSEATRMKEELSCERHRNRSSIPIDNWDSHSLDMGDRSLLVECF